MSQLGRFERTVQDTSGTALSGVSVTIYREGATVNGNQSGTTPLTVTVRDNGKIAASDTVFINTTTGTLYSVDSITDTTVVISGFIGTLSLTSNDRLVPSNNKPTFYSDDNSDVTTSNPLTTSSTGYASCWMAPGVYDYLISGGAATTTLYVSQVVYGSGESEAIYNVKSFGAIGDGTTDDTAAIQAAVDTASNDGGRVYLPAGRYRTTGPITATWTATPATGLPARPLLTEIYGDGPGAILINSSLQNGITEIMCTALASGRGVIELLGTGNTHATTTKVRDLTIRMRGALNGGGGTTSSGAYCIRAGDSTMLHLDNLHLFGAKGIALKISSSASSSTIGTKLSKVYVWSNYNSEWYTVNDSAAAVTALTEESGGAFWDTLYVDSCVFYGMTEWRAKSAFVSNTLFSVNPDRNSGYGNCVNLNYGAAHFLNCYFEDYRFALVAAGNSAIIRNITLDNCYFVSTNNTGTTRSVGAVSLSDGTHGFQQFTLRNCVFLVDTGGHSGGEEIDVAASTTLVGTAAYQQETGLNDATSGGTYSGTRTHDVFEINIDATGAPDTFRWRKRYSGNGYTNGVAITGAAQTLSDGVTVTFAATTGHTNNTTWLIPVGFGGPRNIVITDNSFVNRWGTAYQNLQVRTTFSANFSGNYFIRHVDGKIEARGEYAKGLTLAHSQDTTTLTPGESAGGLELQNENSASVGSEGSESAIAFRSTYRNQGGRYAAIAGRVTSRNSTTQREGGIILFATKDTAADTLTERFRITEEGSFEGPEITNPPAPGVNKGRMYFRDNGAGKTQLVVVFNTGAVQVIATEP